jgi:hypothetical protein
MDPKAIALGHAIDLLLHGAGIGVYKDDHGLGHVAFYQAGPPTSAGEEV